MIVRTATTNAPAVNPQLERHRAATAGAAVTGAAITGVAAAGATAVVDQATRVAAQVAGPRVQRQDEVQRTKDFTHFGASQGVHVLLAKDLCTVKPPVMTLSVHLAGSKWVHCGADVQGNAGRASQLDAFFSCNHTHADNDLQCSDMCDGFTWNSKNGKWVARVRRSKTTGRVVCGGPGSGDACYLSVVLSHPHCCGATSFAALLVADGDRCATCEEVCGRLGTS